MAAGLTLEKPDKFTEAVVEFTQAIQLALTNAEAYPQRGRARANSRETGQALADCNQVIKLKPDHAPAHVGRARILQLGNWIPDGSANYSTLTGLGFESGLFRG